MNANILRLEIEELDEQIKTLKGNRSAKVCEMQANCKHDGIIYLLPWTAGTYFGSSKARRMCSICRLEEESASHYDRFKILPTDKFRTVELSTHEFCGLRI